MKDILTAISTVGFPIVCCMALYYQSIKNMQLYEKMLQELTEKLTNINDRIEELSESIVDNTGKENK